MPKRYRVVDETALARRADQLARQIATFSRPAVRHPFQGPVGHERGLLWRSARSRAFLHASSAGAPPPSNGRLLAAALSTSAPNRGTIVSELAAAGNVLRAVFAQ